MPQHQRVQAPQQVDADAPLPAGARQPVEQERGQQERERCHELEHQHGARHRAAAQPRGGELRPRGQRPVHRGGVAPGEGRQLAHRVADLVQPRRGGHVRVLPEGGDASVHRVVEHVRRPGGRYEREGGDGDQRAGEQHPARGPPPSAEPVQRDADAEPARDHDRPAEQDHQPVGGRGPEGPGRIAAAELGHRRGGAEQGDGQHDRDRDGDQGEPGVPGQARAPGREGRTLPPGHRRSGHGSNRRRHRPILQGELPRWSRRRDRAARRHARRICPMVRLLPRCDRIAHLTVKAAGSSAAWRGISVMLTLSEDRPR